MDAIVEQGPFCTWDLCQAPLSGPPRPGCGSCYAHANGTWIGPAPKPEPTPDPGTPEAREILGLGRPLDAATQSLLVEFTARPLCSALDIVRRFAAGANKVALAEDARCLLDLLDDPGEQVPHGAVGGHCVMVCGLTQKKGAWRRYKTAAGALWNALQLAGASQQIKFVVETDDATGLVSRVALRVHGSRATTHFDATLAEMAAARAVVGI